jgi:hypothetical protein
MDNEIHASAILTLSYMNVPTNVCNLLVLPCRLTMKTHHSECISSKSHYSGENFTVSEGTNDLGKNVERPMALAMWKCPDLTSKVVES